MQILEEINGILTGSLGPFGPLIVVGVLFVLWAVAVQRLEPGRFEPVFPLVRQLVGLHA